MAHVHGQCILPSLLMISIEVVFGSSISTETPGTAMMSTILNSSTSFNSTILSSTVAILTDVFL